MATWYIRLIRILIAWTYAGSPRDGHLGRTDRSYLEGLLEYSVSTHVWMVNLILT